MIPQLGMRIRVERAPDPHPELGNHRFSFAVSLADASSTAGLIAAARERAHPLAMVSGTSHAGSLPLAQGFLSLESGAVAVSAVKMPEDEEGSRLVVRLYETEGRKTSATLRFFCAPASAWVADLNENRLKDGAAAVVEGDTVTVDVEPHAIVTLVVQFEGCRK